MFAKLCEPYLTKQPLSTLFLSLCDLQVVNESQVERDTSEKNHTQRMTDINRSAHGHRHTITIKTREVEAIKNHARTILLQRNQVEKLFLRALETTKKNVIAQRHHEFLAQKRDYDLKLKNMTLVQADGTYPGADSLGPPPRPPPKQSRLALVDLSQEARNASLRLMCEFMISDPEACAIMGPPFTNQGAHQLQRPSSKHSMDFSEGLNLEKLSLSRPDSGSRGDQQGSLTFLTDPSIPFNERERDPHAQAIL
jgi:hypothetical protein